MIPPRLIHPPGDPSQTPEVLISASAKGIVLPSTPEKGLESKVRNLPQCSNHHQPPGEQIPARISLFSLHSFLHILSFYYFKSVNAAKQTSFTQRNQCNGSICGGQGSTMSPLSSLAGEQQEQGEPCRGTFPSGMCQAGSPVCVCAAPTFPLQPRRVGMGSAMSLGWVALKERVKNVWQGRSLISKEKRKGFVSSWLQRCLRRGRTESKW